MSDDESSQNSAGPPSPVFMPADFSEEEEESEQPEMSVTLWIIIPGAEDGTYQVAREEDGVVGRHVVPGAVHDLFADAMAFIAQVIHNVPYSSRSGVLILHHRRVTCELTDPPTYHDLTPLFNDPEDLGKLV